MTTDTLSLFATDEIDAARTHAIDQLHHSTAIYTAESVVDELLAQLDWPRGNARLIDPSCGDAMFLGCALVKVLALHTHADDALPSILEGWEIHPHACAQAKARIEAIFIAHGRTQSAAQRLAAQIVHNRDFLTQGPVTPTYDFVAGNPPYLRRVNIPSLLREEYAAHVPAYAAGDMLHSFIDRLAKCLRPGGEIGLVTSDGWLSNVGAAPLREDLGRRCFTLKQLRRLDVTTAFYRPKQKKAGTPPRIHPVMFVLAHSGEGQAIGRDAIYPDVDASRYAGLPTLAEFATVRLAPWLGTAGRFFVTAEQAAQSNLPKDVLVPVIDTDGIADFQMRTPTRYAIRTEPNVEPCAAVLTHLAKQQGSPSESRQSKAWMPPETFHNLNLEKPSLFLARIARTTQPTCIPSHVLPMNHHLSIVCHDPAMTDKIMAAMSGTLAKQWLHDHGKRLEGGFFQISAPLLRTMPIDFSEVS